MPCTAHLTRFAGVVPHLLGHDGRLIAPLPVGEPCVTPVGQGVVKSFHKTRGIYEVELPWATGYIHKSSINRVPDEAEAAAKAAKAAADVAAAAKAAVRPPVELDDRGLSGDEGDDDDDDARRPRLPFLGNKHMFLYLRAHSVLYERLLKAKRLCKANAAAPKNSTDSSRPGAAPDAASLITPVDLHVGGGGGGGGAASAAAAAAVAAAAAAAAAGDDESESRYKNVLAACYALIEGTIEMGRFEDILRFVLGSDGFELCTLDRVLSLTMKQFNNLAQPLPQNLLQLHLDASQQAEQSGLAAALPAYADKYV